jgi:BirA family biotin operon repressor/biotin-[acetyl-CoA-carboxylase] ligase
LQITPTQIHHTYEEICCTVGKKVKVELPQGEIFEGVATAIASDGAIEVTSGDVTKTFRTADIHHLFTA